MGEEGRPSSRAWARLRQVGVALALAALAASAAYGGDLFGVRTRLQGSGLPSPRPPAASRVAGSTEASVPDEETRVRSYPWWQRVDSFHGVGAATRTIIIDGSALQWRVRWSCESGRLVIEELAQGRRMADATCPRSEVSYSSQPGPTSLQIAADGPWQLEVEQQLDVPLAEPPLPGMTAPSALLLASGSFYDIDQVGRGRVTIYRLENGSHALRLEDFFVTPNVDLELRLSPLPAPRSTDEYLSVPSALVSRLDVTAGAMNFAVPPEVDPTAYRSVVIWCPPVLSAYAAATVAPPSSGREGGTPS